MSSLRFLALQSLVDDILDCAKNEQFEVRSGSSINNSVTMIVLQGQEEFAKLGRMLFSMDDEDLVGSEKVCLG